MRAIHVYRWQDGREEEIAAPPAAADEPRMKHDLRHAGTAFQLQDWRMRYDTDGTRETVLYYAERS